MASVFASGVTNRRHTGEGQGSSLQFDKKYRVVVRNKK
ncbi:hypothetical protein Q7O_000740 [Pectobacterium carotovorum subsp. carotovorum PCCS1]|nr:hypothetical protein [Pectobacterium carotovorum subsp. carotovorum PCCS1]